MAAYLGGLALFNLGLASFNVWRFASTKEALHAGAAAFCFGAFLFCLVGAAVTGK